MSLVTYSHNIFCNFMLNFFFVINPSYGGGAVLKIDNETFHIMSCYFPAIETSSHDTTSNTVKALIAEFC